jgi:hypothetical protein
MSVTTQSIKTATKAFGEAAMNLCARVGATYVLAMQERPVRTTVATQLACIATGLLNPSGMDTFTTVVAYTAGSVWAGVMRVMGIGYEDESGRSRLRDLAQGRATSAEFTARVQASRANTPS